MATPEQFIAGDARGLPPPENLDPRHFYAAYVFDNPVTRRRDVSVLVHEAQHLGYPVRYWWLSEAMDLQDEPDRLVVCVHPPSLGESAGMDLYDLLRKTRQKHRVTWDDFEAAHVEEYRQFGKIVVSPDNIFDPDGTLLFPEPDDDPELLFYLTREDVQFVAQAMLGRDLNREEMKTVVSNLPGALDWIGAVEVTLRVGQAAGKIGPAAEAYEPEEEPVELEPRIRQLPDAGWPECFENEDGHLCNAVHVFEGIDADGQLFVRREWGLPGEPPDDFKPHSWGLAFAPDGSDTLDDVLTRLDDLVKLESLSPEEHTRSEAFYRRFFSKTEGLNEGP